MGVGDHRTKACTIPTSGSGRCSSIGVSCSSVVASSRLLVRMNAASGEVLATYTIARMMHRVLVENWEAEKAVEEAHKKVVEIYARYPEG